MLELIQRFFNGDRRALARAITFVENRSSEGEEVLAAVYPRTGRAHLIGITGSPGVGKSTTVDRLAAHYRSTGRTVGIIAVDPTSPFSGGAVLGDRIRMPGIASDRGVFIRSLAARGHLGGLSVATEDVARVMDAFGFDIVLIETVGAGQSEVEVMDIAHSTMVVAAPGLGDDIQAIKAGILEIGDIFVVNKADRDGADRTVMELEVMLDLGQHQPAWRPPVLRAVARDDVGIVEVVEALDRHRRYLEESGVWLTQARQRAEAKIRQIVVERLAERVLGDSSGVLADLTAKVSARQVDPYSAASHLLKLLAFNE